MNTLSEKPRKLGVIIIGLGGAVATTAVAGIELLKMGAIGKEGLPLSQAPTNLTTELVDYKDLVFGGWDLTGEDLANAAATHNVLTLPQFQKAAPILEKIKPLAAVANSAYCANIEGENVVIAENHREAVKVVRQNLRDFKVQNDCESLVVINLASTEKFIDREAEIYSTIERFEVAMNENSSEISPGMIYAYAAIAEKIPYANFTPSVAADVPALVEFAKQNGVPVGGKDGKTGQTMIKTVLAPAFKTRALKVEGWFSTNILGNRDGLALSNADSLKSKIATKSSVLDQILGYEVENHLVDIRYYKPRGDNKEAWDNIDVTGFLGQPMQIKINFLCKDSILAAPLVIEIARLIELAQRRGESGVMEELGVFFKLPQTENEKQPIHALHEQEQVLFDWLANKSVKSETNGYSNGNGANGNHNESLPKVETVVTKFGVENVKN
ncbi:MAG: inositol-3-phosphate synthase [Pyrinomonadaceae bacterium]|nr:inositol-3-phosphate synthase [Pyrinomonadaceae bacterium]